MDREMIASKVFWHSYTLAQGRCKNGCFLTIKIFNELGMGFLTNENKSVDSIVYLRQPITAFMVKQLFNGNSILIGKSKMAAINWQHIGHLRTLLKQKTNLNKPMVFKFHQCFSMLRCGTAPLRIERGRYEWLPVEQRVCEVCDSDNVEDEMHFLISWNAFIQERT